jgi:hypothetical protein
MYVLRNNEALSCNHCCCGKAISITCWSVCVCVCVSTALVIQHAMHNSHIVFCRPSGSTTFFHIIS